MVVKCLLGTLMSTRIKAESRIKKKHMNTSKLCGKHDHPLCMLLGRLFAHVEVSKENQICHEFDSESENRVLNQLKLSDQGKGGRLHSSAGCEPDHGC
jgi:hypothetical protein